MRKRGQLNISFGWLFALIAGGAILFLAIYASTKIIQSGQTQIDAQTGKQVGILLDPLETGVESAKSTSMTFPVETRILSECSDFGYFGEQFIQVSQKSLNRWTNTNMKISFENKYIFANSTIEGEKFNIFTKPFEFPFKITDLIYIIPDTEEYCFVDAPENIKEEISQLKIENLKINCSEKSKRICFAASKGCYMEVDYNQNKIIKKEGTVYFIGDSLMYAAIFSDLNLYECQIKRLMEKIDILSAIYKDKATFVSRENCNSNLEGDLIVLSNQAKSLTSSINLFGINKIMEDIKKRNEDAICKLW
jgi:hypothetical protein